MKRKFPILFTGGALLFCFVPASADQVTLDDVIIDGSLCVGQDCQNGEAFGFSTVILKENNLRLLFQDTSSSAAFPTTDWQLIANDSSNGGDSHFSIENITDSNTPFRVDATASNHALRVTSAGVTVGGADTPTVRLAQSGVQGWDPYVWDTGANEGGYFVRDATAQTVPFRIESGAVDSAMTLASDGNLTIAGTLAQGSSRGIKHVFPLVTADILAQVKALEVARWQYKNDANQAEHIGPMAEDFYQAFGLGADDKHIAASDIAGIAMASVQALAETIDVQERELAQLQQSNKELADRLTQLEKRFGETQR